MRPYMTEEEARKKWCPMVRVVDHQHCCTNNRGALMDGDKVSCVASDCMWWGWKHSEGQVVHRLGRCEAPGGAA